MDIAKELGQIDICLSIIISNIESYADDIRHDRVDFNADNCVEKLKEFSGYVRKVQEKAKWIADNMILKPGDGPGYLTNEEAAKIIGRFIG